MTRHDLGSLSRDQLIEIILDLYSQVKGLTEELSQRTLPKKTSQNSSLPPSKSDNPNRKPSANPKRRGPKPGHRGQSRKRQPPDVVMELKPTHCQNCHADLTQQQASCIGKSQIVDLPPIKPVVIEAHRFSTTCQGCGHRQAADYPDGFKPQRVFGRQIEALVTYFHHVHHVSYERLTQIFDQIFSLSISQGTVDNILRRTALKLEPVADEIRQRVIDSRVIGSDETSIRVNGQTYWQWVFQTPKATFYQMDKTRSASVIDDVIDGRCPQVWVSDLFSSQLKASIPQRQICHAHQVRDLQYAIDAERSAFAYRMLRLLLQSQRLARLRGEIPDEVFAGQVARVHQTCNRLLSQKVNTKIARRLQKRYQKHTAHLFVFLQDPTVPADNNASERALRNSVVHRKVNGGFRSMWGACAFATVMSVIETAKKEGESVLGTLLAQLFANPLPNTAS